MHTSIVKESFLYGSRPLQVDILPFPPGSQTLFPSFHGEPRRLSTTPIPNLQSFIQFSYLSCIFDLLNL